VTYLIAINKACGSANRAHERKLLVAIYHYYCMYLHYFIYLLLLAQCDEMFVASRRAQSCVASGAVGLLRHVGRA
jgi:hypothetical protein